MKDITAQSEREKTYQLPYLLGVFLAVNAVEDACAVIDGANCSLVKADLVAGNHDLNSTLLSETGLHRVIATMTNPMNPQKNPDKRLAALLNSVAGSGRYGAVLLTSLPFCWLAGMDYDGIARAVTAGAPVGDVPPRSMDSDWLDGYDLSLEALARALPARRAGRRGARKVALAGYLFDRNERDHAANLAELARLLGLCGLELVSVWPSGVKAAELGRVSEASLIVSLPYGRRTARALASRHGARLVETGLPMGLKGTSAWLAAVRRAAGLAGPLPSAVLNEELAAAAAVRPALKLLQNRRAMFAGDPHLYSAFAAFAAELCMDVPLAFLGSSRRPLGRGAAERTVLFAPSVREARDAAAALPYYRRPELAVANSFAITEGLTCGAPAVELGFPSYGHHCLADEPFLAYAGARVLACRLLNALQAGA